MSATALVVFLASAAAGQAQPALRATVYASGFRVPLGFVQNPADRAVQFVVEQGGRIRPIRGGVVLATDFLNLAGAITPNVEFGGEQGLLGLAFAPDYVTSGRFYVNFTNAEGHTVVARFKRSADPLVADPASRFDLRWGGAGGAAFIAQPAANHNGGNLMFGPDGFLYIGLGDGGNANDQGHRAQNPAELLGKMLRVDVNVPDNDPIGYRVPADNPFVSGGPAGTRPEIWSFGLRNPWRYSFDDPARGGTGALVIGDVGQSAWEEIDYEPPNRGGRNYGWRNREGAHDHITTLPPAFTPLTDPIFEYDPDSGNAITGGFVYRGHGLGPAYRGRYFFADFTRGRVWSIGLTIDPSTGEAHAAGRVEHTAALAAGATLGNISSFGVDANAELYLVNYTGGTILKVTGTPGSAGDFDDDGTGDLAIFRPSSGTWFIRNSATGFTSDRVQQWGLIGDLPVPGDYDGDGVLDLAVYRPATATWYVQQSSTSATVSYFPGFAFKQDIPVPGDYDGDGRTDVAHYRVRDGVWSVLTSSSRYVTVRTMTLGGRDDIPVPADYDGDGVTDAAIYHPSTGVWTILTSSSGSVTRLTYQWGLAGDVPVPGDYDGDGLPDLAVYRPASGTWFIRHSTTGFTTSAAFQFGLVTDTPVPADYDGDGKTDLAVFRPSSGTWYIAPSTTSYTTTQTYEWGLAGDMPASNATVASGLAIIRRTVANLLRTADLDGDGRADINVFRPSTGTWFNLRSTTYYTGFASFQAGLPGDVPVSSDYDGDGITDLAVFRPSGSVWFVVNSTVVPIPGLAIQWGLDGDVPVPGDYDADGRADLAVYRPSTGVWYILRSSSNYRTSTSQQWGLIGDVPVPGDYDGDGVTDLAVWRPSSGTWFIKQSSTGYTTSVSFQWGLAGDVTVPGDYDGDGRTDLAVYRRSTGTWFIRYSSTGYTTAASYAFGLGGDTPVPNDYDGDGKTDLAVYRPAIGTWFLLTSGTGFTTSSSVAWGLSGDIPIGGRQ